MSYSTQGASNRQVYDCCAYAQALQQSVDPLQYQLYFGAQESCTKCIDKKAWFKQDKEIVNIESDLLNLTRPLSKCDQYKYNPNCESGPECISTFAQDVPRILSPSLCPIVYNNIPVMQNPGYTLPDTNICGGKNEWTEADSINTFKDYEKKNKGIVGENYNIQDVHMFMNSCSLQPLYNGGMEKVKPYSTNMYNSASYLQDPRFDSVPTKGKLAHQVKSESSDNSSVYDSDSENEQV